MSNIYDNEKYWNIYWFGERHLVVVKLLKFEIELRYLQVLKILLKDHVEGESQLNMGSASN